MSKRFLKGLHTAKLWQLFLKFLNAISGGHHVTWIFREPPLKISDSNSKVKISLFEKYRKIQARALRYGPNVPN